MIYFYYKLEAIDKKSGVICDIANVHLLQEQDIYFVISSCLCNVLAFSLAHTFHIVLVDAEGASNVKSRVVLN